MKTVLDIIELVSYIAIFWIFFTKANKPGWLSVVPVYGLAMMGKLVKKPISGAIAGIASLVILISVISLPLVGMSNKSTVNNIYAIAGISIIVWYLAFLFMLVGMTKTFDKKGGYWVLFIFLPFIAVFMTNSAHFKGNDTNNSASPSTQPQAPQNQASVTGNTPINSNQPVAQTTQNNTPPQQNPPSPNQGNLS